MTPAAFLEQRKPIWEKVENLLDMAGKQGTKKLSQEQLLELTRLYPTIAVDISKARMYKLDQLTIEKINSLAIRSHGLLYSRKKTDNKKGLANFLLSGYPALFRANIIFLALSLLMFIIPMVSTYTIVRAKPETAYIFLPSGLDVENSETVTAEDVSERYRKMPGSIMSASITTNNILVALIAFAMGTFAALGTCYVLLINSVMLGCFIGHFANNGLSKEVWFFLSPHGFLEIFAIIVAGAAGLKLGLSILIPGNMTRKESFKKGASESVLYVLGTIPMFIVAGAIESYITPSYIDGKLKVLIGIGALMSFWPTCSLWAKKNQL